MRTPHAALAGALAACLLLVGCGGDDASTGPAADDGADAPDASGDVEASAADDSEVDDSDGGDSDGGGDGGADGGDDALGTGTAVVEGTTYAFDFVDVQTPGEVGFGVVDRCDGDFMGMGMTAIGYLVDSEGLVALTDDGRPAGTLSVDVAADGQDGLGDAINLDLLEPELQLFLPNGDPGLTLDGTTASGTVTLQHDGASYDVEIVVSCPA